MVAGMFAGVAAGMFAGMAAGMFAGVAARGGWSCWNMRGEQGCSPFLVLCVFGGGLWVWVGVVAVVEGVGGGGCG